MIEQHQQVRFRVYDMTQFAPPGRKPGFYFNIEEDSDPVKEGVTTLVLDGPYETHGAAQAAAIAFIQDALKDWTPHTENF